ncbi:MAG: ABC transporter permease [Streptococcaceae bacterium]|jgi:simple sugar transport system permease protein|nr:ABC transporter permease [Streptococcaceae bacterium]
MNPKVKKILVPIIAVIAGFLLGALIMLVSGYNPLIGYTEMFYAAFGNARSIGETISTAGPLILTALSFAVSMKAGLFNIGMSGQALAGWVSAIWVALSFPDLPRFLLIPMILIVGMIGGLIMGVIPGILKAMLGTSEVIVTIMMNYVILFGSTFLLKNVFSKKIIQAAATDNTKLVGPNATFRISWLSNLTDNSTLNIGIFIAIIALIVMAIIFARTTLGFEIKAVGLNPEASEYAGISAKHTVICSMMIAGALSGLGGVVYGIGTMQYFAMQHASMSIGFDGMAVALLGQNSPIGILFAALLFAVLQVGKTGMTIANIPQEIVSIVTASIIFFIAIKFVIETILPKAREHRDKVMAAEEKQLAAVTIANAENLDEQYNVEEAVDSSSESHFKEGE